MTLVRRVQSRSVTSIRCNPYIERCTNLEIGSVPFCCTLKCEAVQRCHMSCANVDSPPFTVASNNHSNDRFLCGRNILQHVSCLSCVVEKIQFALRRTLRALLSIHHDLLFAACCNSPAFVDTTVVSSPTLDTCNKPGPSLRLTCFAGTVSPGRT